MQFPQAIATVRNAVCAVLRIHPLQGGQVHTSMVGTAWCIVENRYLVTAHHIFNGGQRRDSNDRFFVFSVPQNDLQVFHVPVVTFPLEDPSNDMAIIEIDPSGNPNFSISSVPVTFRAHQDGEKVLTFGFPAPKVSQTKIDQNLNWLEGNLFLKGHANEGIISGQFEIQGQLIYELNVGWHQGESGGPIVSLDPIAAFSIMQQYRKVSTPHGIVPGPHQGRTLNLIKNSLQQLGANII